MMVKRTIQIIAIGLLLGQSIYGKQLSNKPRAAKFVVEVGVDSPNRMKFKVDDEPVPNDDLLLFLHQHESRYAEGATAYVMVPSSLTIYDIGAIDATLNKAGYHSTRFFLSAPNSDFAVEVVFKPQVPLKRIRSALR